MSSQAALRAKIEAGRRVKPLKTVITEFGDAPANWSKFERCPFCGQKGHGEVKAYKGNDRFKCWFVPCPSNNESLDEIGYLAAKTGQSRRDACLAFLKMSGQWEEAKHAPSVMPGQRARRAVTQVILPPEEGGKVAAEPETEPAEAAEVVQPFAGDGAELDPGETHLPDCDSLARNPDGIVKPCNCRAYRDGNVPDHPVLAPTEPESEPPPVEGLETGAETPPEEPPAAVSAPAEAAAEGGEKVAVPLATQALRAFYAQLTLSAADAEKLCAGRGLVGPMLRLAGIASNPRSNRELLLKLADTYPTNALVEAGLWSRDGAAEPKPSGRYYGFHTWEEKRPDGSKEACSGWTEPVLIPYFDREGQIVALRPHRSQIKGMIIRLYEAANCLRRPEAGAILQEAGWAEPAVLGEDDRSVVAVVTEAEFKALALLQSAWFGERKRMAIASIPGIQTSKNLWGDIQDWLDVAVVPGATVLAAFDNEDKGTPGLPGYKAEEKKRYDAEIWARYLAWRCKKESYDGRVASLPNEWRDAKGKVDWDGALAQQLWEGELKEAGKVGTATGTDGGTLAEGLRRWEVRKGRIAASFRKVLAAAVKEELAYQAGLFDNSAEKHIRTGLEKLKVEPKLPVGGSAEKSIAVRIRRFVGRSLGQVENQARGYLMNLANSYDDLGGGYWILRPLSEKQQEKWQSRLVAARDAGQVEYRRMCDLALKGIPERISDFYMEPHYAVKKRAGGMTRYVSLHNIYGGRSRAMELDAEAFGQPAKFRTWTLWAGNYSFGLGKRAGEIQLQMLHADINRELTEHTVIEVDSRGHHEESGLWFFEDAVFLPEGGNPFIPDDRGIVKVFDPRCPRCCKALKATDRGPLCGPCAEAGFKKPVEWASWEQGYLLSEPALVAEKFKQPMPRLRPEVRSTVEAEVALLGELGVKLYQTVGTFEAYIGIGAVLANLAEPEIREAWNSFPGLWVHGEQGSGKTSVARWLLTLLGLYIKAGFKLADASPPGLGSAMKNLGSLPVWLEEYQPNTPQWVIDLLKSTYGHEPGAKMTAARELHSGVIVSGVATCRDAQTKSRFAHVQLAKPRRLIDPATGEPYNHFDWFQEHSKRFYLIGRRMMEHRREYADRVQQALKEWLQSPDMAHVEERARMVHGVAYAGFVAAVGLYQKLLGATPATADFGRLAKNLDHYRAFLVEHCMGTAAEVRGSVNANLFWTDLLGALKAKAFGETRAERAEYFRWEEEVCESADGSPLGPPGAEHQGKMETTFGTVEAPPWIHARLYFNAAHVLPVLARWKRGQGLDPDLTQSDLRAQLAVKPYFVAGDHIRRFGVKTGRNVAPERCWCIDVSAHELGCVPVDDAAFIASLFRNGDPQTGRAIPREEWCDPRRGELWAIGAALASSGNEEDK